MNAIEEIVSHAQSLRESVSPGQPAELNAAASANDVVWQGDVGLIVVDRIPEGYERVAKPKAADRQLAPGNTQGSRHLLRSLKTVEFYRSTLSDELWGPAFVCREETVVEHPVHGDVTIAAGHTIRVRYQREYDAEQRRERRNAD